MDFFTPVHKAFADCVLPKSLNKGFEKEYFEYSFTATFYRLVEGCFTKLKPASLRNGVGIIAAITSLAFLIIEFILTAVVCSLVFVTVEPLVLVCKRAQHKKRVSANEAKKQDMPTFKDSAYKFENIMNWYLAMLPTHVAYIATGIAGKL